MSFKNCTIFASQGLKNKSFQLLPTICLASDPIEHYGSEDSLVKNLDDLFSQFTHGKNPKAKYEPKSNLRASDSLDLLYPDTLSLLCVILSNHAEKTFAIEEFLSKLDAYSNIDCVIIIQRMRKEISKEYLSELFEFATVMFVYGTIYYENEHTHSDNITFVKAFIKSLLTQEHNVRDSLVNAHDQVKIGQNENFLLAHSIKNGDWAFFDEYKNVFFRKLFENNKQEQELWANFWRNMQGASKSVEGEPIMEENGKEERKKRLLVVALCPENETEPHQWKPYQNKSIQRLIKQCYQQLPNKIHLMGFCTPRFDISIEEYFFESVIFIVWQNWQQNPPNEFVRKIFALEKRNSKRVIKVKYPQMKNIMNVEISPQKMDNDLEVAFDEAYKDWFDNQGSVNTHILL